MLFQLIAQALPESPMDILMIPIGLTLLGFFIFASGWWVENRLTKAPWKWIAVLPVAYALWAGWGPLSTFLGDPIYSNLMAGRKWAIAHWAAVLIPVLGLAAIVLFHFFQHKLNLSMDE